MSTQIINPHSISFIDSKDESTVNTWDTWHMLPTSRPIVSPPEVKTEYVTIPGMSGFLDYTETLSGTVVYGARKGSWEFMLLNYQDGYPQDEWARQYSSILASLHGIKKRVILRDDDPAYYYEGRIEVNNWKSDKEHSLVTINYMLDPYKNPTVTTEEDEWKWDSLFGISKIIYGSFDVMGSKYRTLINSSTDEITVKTESSVQMTAYYYSSESSDVVTNAIIIPAGITDSNSNLRIKPGRTKIRFDGYGHIKLYYGEGRIL